MVTFELKNPYRGGNEQNIDGNQSKGQRAMARGPRVSWHLREAMLDSNHGLAANAPYRTGFANPSTTRPPGTGVRGGLSRWGWAILDDVRTFWVVGEGWSDLDSQQIGRFSEISASQ